MPSKIETTWIYAEAILLDDDAPGAWMRIDVEGRIIMVQIPTNGITREDADDVDDITPDTGAAMLEIHPDGGSRAAGPLLTDAAPKLCPVCAEGAADDDLGGLCLECDDRAFNGELATCGYCHTGRAAGHIIATTGTVPTTYPVCPRCLPSAMSESEGADVETIATVRDAIAHDRGAWTPTLAAMAHALTVADDLT